MKMTHFQRKSIMVVKMSERYRLILRGTFFGRTFSSPDLLIKRRLLKPSRPSGISLAVSTRSEVESTNTPPLVPSLTSVEDSLSSSIRLRASTEFTRPSLEFAEFMCYTRTDLTISAGEDELTRDKTLDGQTRDGHLRDSQTDTCALHARLHARNFKCRANLVPRGRDLFG